MKKLILSLAILATNAFCANSQEAFSHLSLCVEVGTTGPGLNLAMPVVSDKVFVRLGVNFPSLAYENNNIFSTAEVNKGIEIINTKIDDLNKNPLIVDKFSTIKGRLEDPTKLSVMQKANFGALNLLFQYYPFRKTSFHVVAGFYYGFNDTFLSADLNTSDKLWSDYKAIRAEVEALNEKAKKHGENFELPDVQGNISGRTFMVKEKDGHGYLNAGLNIARFRPYVGLGFGRTVPGTDKRLGFCFDLGCWFHQAPKLVSENEVPFDSYAYEIDFDLNQIKQLNVYPRVSFSLNYLLF